MWYYEKWQKIWWSFWLKRHIFRWLCGFVIFAHNGTKTWLSEGKFSHNMEKTIKNRYVFVTFAVHHKSTGYGSTNDTIWNRESLCTHTFNCCLIAMFFYDPKYDEKEFGQLKAVRYFWKNPHVASIIDKLFVRNPHSWIYKCEMALINCFYVPH